MIPIKDYSMYPWIEHKLKKGCITLECHICNNKDKIIFSSKLSDITERFRVFYGIHVKCKL
jgi:hypothetical protein